MSDSRKARAPRNEKEPKSMRRYARRLCASLALLVVALAMLAPVRAVEPDEVLADPRLEARARNISGGLRCLVCQNQSIDDSHAPLARDLRKLVRERLVVGDSDQGVRDYIVQRYGEFVLLKPPLNIETVLLWLAPLLLLAGGALFAYRQLRPDPGLDRAAASGEAPLTPEEQRRLNDILQRDT